MSLEQQSTASSRIATQHWKSMAMVLGLLTCSVVFFVFNPANFSIIPLCPFRALTGLHCPGCGILRALHQLLRGDLLAALGLNPLIILSLPFAGYGLLSIASAHLTRRQLPNIRIPHYFVCILVGVVILFWILRNIPVYPFSVLAP